jgi:SAM-dependent methyltransferase
VADTREHWQKNRDAWTAMSEGFAGPGRLAWSEHDIKWGIWRVPEESTRAFGDLSSWRGKRVVELGCGTAYFSAWFAKIGAWPVGVDITPAQLANARKYQEEFGFRFPLIQANAEVVPLRSGAFDLAFSEYGASIWCDPYRWIPEAARLLRPGGTLVFLRNSTLVTLCMPLVGAAEDRLVRPLFGLNRMEWDDGSVEFHIPAGEMIRLLRSSGFEVEDLIEVQATDEPSPFHFDYVTHEWSRMWPSEEIWRARKRA